MSLPELLAFKQIEDASSEAELDLVLLDPYYHGYGAIELRVEARRKELRDGVSSETPGRPD